MIIKKKLPWRITFDTNPGVCNLKCIMCDTHSKYASKNKELGIMDISLFESVVNDCIKEGDGLLKEIIPSTMGEPLLYPYFVEFVNIVKKNNLKMNLTTNGTFPNYDIGYWSEILLLVCSDIKISINSIKPGINERIMQRVDTNKQLENIRMFIYKRNALRKVENSVSTLTLQVTFMKSNYAFLPELIRFAVDNGIDRVKGHHVWVTFPEVEKEKIKSNEDIKIWNRVIDEIYRIVENSRTKLQNFNKIDTVKGPVDNRYREVCPFVGKEAWISYDGTFNVCCAPSHLRVQFGYFGNVKDDSFVHIWNSSKYDNFVTNWGNHSLCKQCPLKIACPEETNE